MNKYHREEDRHYWDGVDEYKEDAVICDVDGTLALFGTENPYDRDYSKDSVNKAIKMIIWGLRRLRYKIIIVSGRYEKNRAVTQKWLFDQDVPYSALFMRPDDDDRPDNIIKEEIYNREIKERYNILCAFDDRLRILRTWHNLGIYTFNVNQTNEEV